MVRPLFILSVLLATAVSGTCQSLSFGFRICPMLSPKFTSDGPREYAIFNIDGNITEHIGGEISFEKKQKQTMALPEFYMRYKLRNRVFVQLGYSTLSGYSIGYDFIDKRGESGRFGTTFSSITPYLSASFYLSQKHAIRPYVVVGLSETFITDTFVGAPNWLSSAAVDDVTDYRDTYLNGRCGIGLLYFSLHLEAYYQQNIQRLEISDNPMLKGFSNFNVAIGYNLFTINTVKKKKI